MEFDMALVFALLGAVIVLFLSGRLRLDVVAVMLMITLALTGILTPAQVVAGFGNTVIALIAGLFVVGEGLSRTGVAAAMGAWLVRKSGSNPTALKIRLMMVVAGLSAIMSSTGAVAIFIPVVLGLTRRANLDHTKLLMPMAFAALMGGMLTLIGTPPNLVVSEELVANGFKPFGFLTFTPVGLAVLAVGILYLLTVGARLLGGSDAKNEDEGPRTTTERSISDLAAAYEVEGDIGLAQIMSPSPLHGVTIRESGLKSEHGLTVVGFQRTSGVRTVARTGSPGTALRSGDILLLVRDHGRALELSTLGLALLDKQKLSTALENELGVVEVMVPPRSRALGKTILELEFRRAYRLSVFGIMHKGELVTEGMDDHQLAMGDTLLLGGSWRRIDEMRQNPDLLVLQMPSEWRDLAPAYAKAPWALAIVGAMVALMVLNVVPAVIAVMMAALALVLTGCLTMPEAYRAINWQSLVLIAGMLPMATALGETGGLQFIVEKMMVSLGGFGPYGIMGVMFLLTAVFSQFISNTATTVLLAPIAIAIAKELGVSPYPLVMAVAIAASAAFVTPVASPVNTLVLGPGGYEFTDFVKVGVPMVILTLIITLLVVPLILPFGASAG